ncbi:hypothetical protein AGMMS50230_22270 [Spirochaetia bacterium]|nr:hypothetical protein AGMMS50230_22270 [Spirochaetia bacterium]
MASNRRHKNDTASFAELTFAEQAKSINGSLSRLMAAIQAHERRAKSEGRSSTLPKAIKTLQNKVNDLQEKWQENLSKLL